MLAWMKTTHVALLLVACVAACETSADVAPDAGVDASAGAGAPVLVTEPDEGMAPIYALMSSATRSIDMTMYELDDTMATSILTAAAQKGVVVRVILDQNGEMSANATAYAALTAPGSSNVTVHWANPGYALTHQKTITVDGTTSAIMTLNFSAEDYKTSRDFAFITTDAVDVAAIEATFAADLTDAAITPPTGTNLVWSPTNAQTALVSLIEGAQTSLLVNEEMSYDVIVSALAVAARRGVDVKIVMEASTDYDANFTALESAGAEVSLYRHSASIYIHAKVVLADYGTSTASVFIGSENFSYASLTENRELGIITSDAATMTAIHTTLTSDFAGGKPSVPASTDAGTPGDAAM